MKKRNIGKKLAAGALALGLVGSLFGCGSTATESTESAAVDTEETAEEAQTEETQAIKVAVAPGYYPITYADDNGDAQGYDVDVFRAIDELLPQYEFTYEIADKETMNVGVQTGTYQVGINSLFKTDERLETYLLPETNMGYTAVGAIYREGEETITSFQDIYDRGLLIYQVGASGGIKSVIDNWNEENPDAQLSFEVVASTNATDGLDAIRTGETDVVIHLIPVYNLWDEETTAGLTISEPLAAVPTYAIVNKDEAELNDAINEALITLRDNGTLSELSVEHFGYDVFELGE